eukprot:CAMPEP_0113318216 /NCGR_PEP_ID=MMETSP0010_2-20120614/12856_1 /TAXON_ID=216773 ORGANISM="Corethron hystrix, Strain 308" /NCGR_SAMPLE_ID=MMETSP0010_2 /ASSEMBLY_ACC=CAM_ASM_000155 /LENGTH=309 /DNA_ID=CAMNT_0000175439 /DNA_START=117 /DNA_END=1046 /DNA_ORIENTATION=+ /assembly_acc=CAM_ASM_000155
MKDDEEYPCAHDIIPWLDEIQLRDDAEKDLYKYLYSNIMPFDVPNAESLGFHGASTEDDLPDGLSNGIVGPTISFTLDAKQKYPWTSHVPKDIYFEYVASFCSVNEPRNNWRPLFHAVVEKIVQELTSGTGSKGGTPNVEQVVRAVNQNIWDRFHTEKEIFFQSGQTPLIYDPMSILAYGYASCTGLSIFLVDALRAAGIPARLAGTPAWNGEEENGNHTWIEFFGSDSNWHIMESKPASGQDDKDLLDPCQWWFCNHERVSGTSFYAARLDRSLGNDNVFPLAWDMGNHDVIGEDRTSFMEDLCSQCH